MSRRRVLILAGDFVEDYELIFPFHALQMVGHDVRVACPEKRAGERIATAIHDFEGHQTYTEKPGHNFTLNATFAELRPEEFDGLVVPGGRAPEYLRLFPRVLDFVRFYFQANRPVCVVCHGAQLLTAAGVVRGRRLTAYPACRPEIESAGGQWVDPQGDYAFVHVDGPLVTGPAWPANPTTLREFLRLLGTPVAVE